MTSRQRAALTCLTVLSLCTVTFAGGQGQRDSGVRENPLPKLFQLTRTGSDAEKLAATYSLLRVHIDPGWDLGAAVREAAADETHTRRLATRMIHDAPITGLFASALPEIVATSLGSLGPRGKPAIPLLTAMLQDPLPGVQLAAAAALIRIEPNRAGELRPRILKALRSTEIGVRRSAISAIREVEHPDCDWALRMMTEDTHPDIQRQAWRVIRDRRRKDATAR